jgi:hypothetical protein
MGEKPPLLPIFPRILGDYFLHYLWFYLPASADIYNSLYPPLLLPTVFKILPCILSYCIQQILLKT